MTVCQINFMCDVTYTQIIAAAFTFIVLAVSQSVLLCGNLVFTNLLQ